MDHRKEQIIKNRINLTQQASKKLTILEHVSKAIGLHLDQTRVMWERSFEIKYEEPLDLSQLILWDEYKSMLEKKQQLTFIEERIELFDLFAYYAPEYLKKLLKKSV